MKASSPIFLSIAVFSAIATVRSAPMDRTAIIQRAVATGEQTWAAAQDPERQNPRSSEFFSYALALCEATAHPERLEQLLAVAARMQDLNPQSDTYGNFRWNWSDTNVVSRHVVPGGFYLDKT